MRRRLLPILFAAAVSVAVAGAGVVHGQSPGTVLGAVFAEGGNGPVGGVTVRLEQVGSDRTLVLVADGQGRFAHVGVRPGFYTVFVERAGYAPVEVRGVEVRPGDRVRLNVEVTPADEAPFRKRVIRYRRPLVNTEDGTLTTRVL